MEQQIKQTAAKVKWLYILFLLLPLVIIVFGETEASWVGAYASNEKMIYWAETIVILLTFFGIPLSLKLFAWILANRIDRATLPVALRLYVWWSGMRLALLALPVFTGLFIYYGLMSNKGILCALMAITASLFCLPSERRLRKELQIDKE